MTRLISYLPLTEFLGVDLDLAQSWGRGDGGSGLRVVNKSSENRAAGVGQEGHGKKGLRHGHDRRGSLSQAVAGAGQGLFLLFLSFFLF